jgi:ADP-ribose pyrophosphatase YjhB (NUDIX family)
MLGANIAIIRDDKVLLTMRDDFRVWCLPGGHVDLGETTAQAAIREAREETGLDVRLTRLVGIYSRPQWPQGFHIVLYAAEITGGELRPDPHEVVAIDFFDPHDLPADLLVDHRQRVLDAVNGVGGAIARCEQTAYPPDLPIDREALYAACAASGLPRNEFYARHFGPLEQAPGIIEVNGIGDDERHA